MDAMMLRMKSGCNDVEDEFGECLFQLSHTHRYTHTHTHTHTHAHTRTHTIPQVDVMGGWNKSTDWHKDARNAAAMVCVCV